MDVSTPSPSHKRTRDDEGASSPRDQEGEDVWREAEEEEEENIDTLFDLSFGNLASDSEPADSDPSADAAEGSADRRWLRALRFDGRANYDLVLHDTLCEAVDRFKAHCASVSFLHLSVVCPGSGGSLRNSSSASSVAAASPDAWPGNYSGKTVRFRDAVRRLPPDCPVKAPLDSVVVLRLDESVRGDDGDAGNRKILQMIHRKFIPNPPELTTANQCTMMIAQFLERVFIDAARLTQAISARISTLSPLADREEEEEEEEEEGDGLAEVEAERVDELRRLKKDVERATTSAYLRFLSKFLRYKHQRRLAPIHAFLRGLPDRVWLDEKHPSTTVAQCASFHRLCVALPKLYQRLVQKRALVRFKAHPLPSIVWTSRDRTDDHAMLLRNDLDFLTDDQIDELAVFDLNSVWRSAQEEDDDDEDEDDEEEEELW